MARPSNALLMNEQATEQLFNYLEIAIDPDETLSAAGLGRGDLRKLLSDDEISQSLDTRLEALMSVPWRLEPEKSAAHDFVNGEIKPLIEPMIRGMWSAVPFGYSVIERVYEKKGGNRIGLKSTAEKPFEWFGIEYDGTLRYFPIEGSDSTNGLVVDTQYKFVLTRRNPTYRNPYGEALLSRLYWPWFFRKNGWQFWMQFLERFGTPLLLGKGHDTANIAEKLAKAVQDAAIAVPADSEVTAIQSTSNGESFVNLDNAIVKRIQKVILGRVLLGDMSTGSRAAQEVEDRVRIEKKTADIRLVTSGIQNVVDALVGLNFPGQKLNFVMEDSAGVEKARADRDSVLVNAGIIKLTDQYIGRAYDFEPGDYEIPSTSSPMTDSGGAMSSVGHVNFESTGQQQRFTADQQDVEILVNETLSLATSPIPADEIKKAILSANDPDDLVEKLAQLYDRVDTINFRELTERALFAADVLGFENSETNRGFNA